MKNLDIWSEVHNDFEDEGIVYIDGYTTADPDENGGVIATIDLKTNTVTYIDPRAKTDSLAQEVINDVLNNNSTINDIVETKFVD